MRKSWTMVQR